MNFFHRKNLREDTYFAILERNVFNERIGYICPMRFILFFSLLLSGFLCAQVNVKDSLHSVSIIGIGGGINAPSADLKTRFDYFTSIHANYYRKQASGLIWGADISYYFGNKVIEDHVLNGIDTEDGFIIGGNGTLYEPLFFMRGYSTSVKIGKLFPVIGPNKNSGIYLMAGGGYLQHKIRIETERNAFVPALTKEYLKGYDRLTNGILFQPTLGYLHLSNSRLLNFSIQLEYYLGFTQNRRSFNFDEIAADKNRRNDNFLNVRLNWLLPVYKKKAKDFYYF